MAKMLHEETQDHQEHLVDQELEEPPEL